MMLDQSRRILLLCLCFLFPVFCVCAGDYIQVSNPPGIYNEDITLSLQPPGPGISIFYQILIDADEYGPWIPFQNPIELTTVEGEEALFYLHVGAFTQFAMVEEESLFYNIDKKSPYPPLLNMPQGEYIDDSVVSFLNKDKNTIVYSINSLVLETGKEWKGENLYFTGESGKRTHYTIQAYTLDGIKNRSDVITYHYYINKTDEASSPPSMEIKSPVPGVFANKQLLYIVSENCSWIKYTIDGTEPEEKGIYYTEPILIDATGKVTVKVFGMPRLVDSFPFNTEIHFEVNAGIIGTLQVNKPPGDYYADTQVFLSGGSGTMFHYSFDEMPPTQGDKVTRGEIPLAGNENEEVFLPLRVLELKSGGSAGPEYRYFYCINKRRPVITRITVSGEGPESPSAEVKIQGTRDALIYYTLDGTIPDQSSLLYSEPFRVTRKDAYPGGNLIISARAYDPSGNSKSTLRWRHVSFLPDIPVIPDVTLSSVGKTNLPVIMKSGDSGTIVYEVATDGTEPPDPSRESERAYGDIRFAIPMGMAKQYILKCASTDKDFITVSPPVRFEFFIDRLPPPNPVIRGAPAQGFTRHPVILTIDETGVPVYYQLTSNGGELALKGNDSLLYTAPIYFPAGDKEEKTYRVRALSIDEMHNVSFSLFESVFTIDTLVPDPLDPPYVRTYGEDIASLYSVAWDLPENSDIFYHVEDENNNKGEQEYLKYTGPFVVDFSRKTGGIIVKGFVQDFAGNKSESSSFKVDPTKKKSLAPAITGVADGGYYNRKVSVELRAGEGVIRYELTDDGRFPGFIKADSPEYTGPLVLDVPYGEERQYRLRACVTEEGVWNITSRELYVEFVIDKIPPDPPRLTGVDEQGYYYDKTTAAFAPTDDSIYYEIIPAHKYTNIIIPQEFTLYDSDVILDTPPGSVSHFILLAFSVDRAGNLSKERPEWRISIDKKSIFVSPGGNDMEEGTRKYPFATINRAIEYAYESGRTQILCAHGIFHMKKGVVITSDISIQGGYNPFTWEPGGPGDLTIIDSSTSSIYSGFPFIQEGSHFSLSHLEFRDSETAFPGFIKNTGGELTLEAVTFSLENEYSISALSLENGTVEVLASEFKCNGSRRGSFINAKKSNVFVTSSEFHGPDGGEEFTAIRINGGEECVFQDTSIFPGKAGITRSADMYDSRVLFNNCRIDTGEGTGNAVGLSLNKSVANIQMSILNCNKNSRYAMGISSEKSKLTIDSTIINVNGGMGATGIRVREGLINLFLSTIKSSPMPDFLYLFDLTHEKGSFVGNMIIGSDSSEALCGIFTNSDSYWINNTIVGGTGSALSSAFIINGDTTPHFINNIIARPGEPAGDALHFIGGTKVQSIIAHNNFTGWKNIIKIDFIKGNTGPFTSNPSQEFYKNTIDMVNNFDGDPYGGNIHGNISEPFSLIFARPGEGDFHLSPHSPCINTGMDVSHYIFSGIVMDIDGEERPGGKRKPVYDIGADEFYEDLY